MNSSQDTSANIDKDFNFEIFSKIQDKVIIYEIDHDILDNVADLSVVYANAAYLNENDDPVGKTISELYDEDTAEYYLKAATQILSSGEGKKFEVYFKSKDEYQMVSAFSPDDELLITINSDITGSKKALYKSQKIIEEIDEAYFDLNNDWQFISSNSKIESIIGKKKEELMGKNIWEEFSELKDADYYTQFHEAKSQNTDLLFNFQSPKSGKWYRIHAYPYSEGLQVYLTDINQEITAQKELDDIEIKFKTLFEENNDAVIISDIKTGRYINVNRKTEELTGFSKEELLSMGTGETSDDLKEMAIEELRKLSKEGNIKIESSIHTRDKGIVPIEVSTSIIETAENIYSFSILRDISTIKEVEKEKKEINTSIEKYKEKSGIWKEKLQSAEERLLKNEKKLLVLQQELQESESRYRAISKNLPSVLMRYNRDLKVIYLLPSAEHSTDVSANDFVGKTNREFGMPEELCNLWDSAIEKVFQTGETQEIEFKFPALKNKDPKSFHLKFVPEFTVDGKNIQHVLGISTEVKESKESKIKNKKLGEELQELKDKMEISKQEINAMGEKLRLANEKISKEKQRLEDKDKKLFEREKDSLKLLGEIEAIYNSAPIGLCTLDRDLRFKRVNKVLAEINGLSIEEHIGKRIHDIAPDMAEQAEDIARFIFKNGLPVLDAEFSRDQDGELRTWTEQWVPLKDNHGETVEINVSMLETTQIKKCEMKLTQVQDNLEEKFSEQLSKYKRGYESIKKLYSEVNEIIEASDDLIAAWNTRYELIAFNNAYKLIFMKIFNREPELGMNIRELFLDSPESHFEAIKFWESALKGKRFSVELVFSIDSQKVFYEFTYYPIRNKQGNVTGASHIARNITERQKSKEKLKKLVEELKISNEELEKFSYLASHDLQEPLRDIKTFTELLENSYKGKFDDYADELMEYIIEAAEDMKNLIDGLLEFSNISTGGDKLQSIYTNSMIDHVIDNFKPSIEGCRGMITHDDLPNIKGDAAQLQRVFHNLISNAIKFRKPDEPPEIHISAYEDLENKEYLFSIRDNGIGIEEQYMERIFQIFQRLNSPEDYKGIGIGLAMVKRIIERHGGRVWVESIPGEGSTFYFTLPDKTN